MPSRRRGSRAARRSLWAAVLLLAAATLAMSRPAAAQLPGGEEDWAEMWSELYPEEAQYRKKGGGSAGGPEAPAPPRALPTPVSSPPRATRRPRAVPPLRPGPPVPITAYADPERVAREMREARRRARLRRAARANPYLWAGAVLGNIAYVPAKAVYAAAGAITAGVAWALTRGDQEAAERIWRPAFGGHWVLTPERLAAVEVLHFSGR